MKICLPQLFNYLLALNFLVYVSAVELTFELPDNAKECFHEDIKKGTKTTLEFQVVSGGNYDVDVTIEGPHRQILYREVKQQYGQHTFNAESDGTYLVCFSNEFSTFTHKLVYMDFQVGEEAPLPGISEHLTAMTQMETSSHNIHGDLNSVIDYQTHHRLKEAQSRKRAEELHEKVFLWALGETIGIITISIGQVLILRSFFADKPQRYQKF